MHYKDEILAFIGPRLKVIVWKSHHGWYQSSCAIKSPPASFVCWDITSQTGKFMGPTWGPSVSCRPQMDPMLASWTMLSETTLQRVLHSDYIVSCPSNFRAIVQSKYESRGLETLRDLTIRHLKEYWDNALISRIPAISFWIPVSYVRTGSNTGDTKPAFATFAVNEILVLQKITGMFFESRSELTTTHEQLCLDTVVNYASCTM